MVDRGFDDTAPCGLRAGKRFLEEGREHHARQVWILLVGLLDVVEELGPDDAAAPPDGGEPAKVQVPLELLRAGGQVLEALRVRHDLRRVKGLLHVIDQRARSLRRSRSREDVRRFHAPRLLARQHAGEDGLRDAGQRHPELQRRLARPAAGALLLRLVLDRVDERLTRPIAVLGQDVGSDLDQVRLQPPLVPAAENRRELVRRQTERAAQQVVRFRDQLDVGVLDPVVHHLHEMPGAVRPDVRAARDAVNLRRDGGQHAFDSRVGLTRPAGHQARPVQRALLPAGDAAADVSKAELFHRGSPPLRVSEEGVAAIDDDVAFVENFRQRIDRLVHGRPGVDHHQHGARRFQNASQLLQGRGGCEVALRSMGRDEVFGLAMRAVVDRDFCPMR